MIQFKIEESEKLRDLTKLSIKDAMKIIQESYEKNETFKRKINAINAKTVKKGVVSDYITQCDSNFKSIQTKVNDIEDNHTQETRMHVFLERDYLKANNLRDEIESLKQSGYGARKLFYLKYMKVFLYIMKIGKGSSIKVPLSKTTSHILIDFIKDIVKPYASTIRKVAVYCFECHTIQFRDKRRRERNIMRCERGKYKLRAATAARTRTKRALFDILYSIFLGVLRIPRGHPAPVRC